MQGHIVRIGFAAIPTNISRDDALALEDAYIRSVAICAPPRNKPNSTEILSCSEYHLAELTIFEAIKLVIVLGGPRLIGTARSQDQTTWGGYIISVRAHKLLASYHPSRQNTNTRKPTSDMWINIFKTARSIVSKSLGRVNAAARSDSHLEAEKLLRVSRVPNLETIIVVVVIITVILTSCCCC